MAPIHGHQDVRLERGDREAGTARQDCRFGKYRRKQREMGNAPPAQRDMPADEVDDVRWNVLHDLRGGVERKRFPGPDAARRKGAQNGRPHADQQNRQERVDSAGEDEHAHSRASQLNWLSAAFSSMTRPVKTSPSRVRPTPAACNARPHHLARFEPSGLDEIKDRAEWGPTPRRNNAEIMPPPPAPVPFEPLSNLVGAMMSGVPKDFAHRIGRRPRATPEDQAAGRVGVALRARAEQLRRDLARRRAWPPPAREPNRRDAFDARCKVYPERRDC